MFKKEDKKQQIINSQKELIDKLSAQIDELKTELELRQYPEMSTYDDAKAFMFEVEKDSIVLKEEIAKVREVQKVYEVMIEKIKKIQTEYKNKLKELNESLEVISLDK